MKKVRILGIESSCDETSVSVVEKSATGKVKIEDTIQNYTIYTDAITYFKNKEIILIVNYFL